jgi:hypothetical protein
MLQWLRRRRQGRAAGASRRRGAHGKRAYRQAGERERDVVLPDGTTHARRTPAHWRRVAQIAARMTGKRIGVDTATPRKRKKDGAYPFARLSLASARYLIEDAVGRLAGNRKKDRGPAE